MKLSNIARIFIVALVAALCFSAPAAAQSKKEAARQLAELRERLQKVEAELAILRGEPLGQEEVIGEYVEEEGEVFEEDVEELTEEEISQELEALEEEQPAEEAVAEEPAAEEPVEEFSEILPVEATSDDLFESRLSRFSNVVDVPFNELIRNNIKDFLSSDVVSETIGLYEMYADRLKEVFRDYDLPEELAALAIVESGMDPQAVSWAGYRGMWQMGYALGKNYGLYIDNYVDERLDVLKSTEVVAKYISDAYAQFGDYALAIAAYNCGAGNVRRAMDKAGSSDFWDVYEYLPGETRTCVPEFLAALYGANYSRAHGIEPDNVAAPAETVSVDVSQKLHFQQIADVLGTPLEDIQQLNPQYIHDIVPGNERIFTILIPSGLNDSFRQHESEIYAYKAETMFNPVVKKQVVTETEQASSEVYVTGTQTSSSSSSSGNSSSTSTPQKVTYKVKSGDSLGKIAEKYHVTVGQLKSWNNLKSDTIQIGQTLSIYGRSSSASTSTSSGYTTYTVKSGDSLSKIASKYRTTVDRIKKYNNLKSDNIRIGQTLKIPR